jgi:hypothetical protein
MDADLKEDVKRINLVDQCVNAMSTINPAYLEPVVMDLYNHVFALTKDAVKKDQGNALDLVRGFANPKTKRKAPSDLRDDELASK